MVVSGSIFRQIEPAASCVAHHTLRLKIGILYVHLGIYLVH
jgi:hypothetical protein